MKIIDVSSAFEIEDVDGEAEGGGEMTDLKNRVAIVTGGNHGNLGPLWVRMLKDLGMDVHVIDLPDWDVTDRDRIAEYRHKMNLAGILAPYVIVNNAAVDPKPSGQGGFWQDFGKIVDVNLKGAANVIETFVEDMTYDGGVIINIGSMLGFVAANWHNYSEGFMKPAGYNVSKAGLLGLTRSVGTYYAQWGVRCCMLALGPVESPHWQPEFKERLLKQMPLGRFITEDDMRAALHACLFSPSFNAREVLIDTGYSAL